MKTLPSRYRHVDFDEVASTNAIALDFAARGEGGNLWVTAKTQTGGRGRRGRDWVSQEGNLFASLLLIDPSPVDALAHLPLVISTAVHRAICDLLPPAMRARVSIKWPNDILVDGKKVSGMLLESNNLPDGRRAVVVGIGINCRAHPSETDGLDAANLSQAGFDMDPAVLFPYLANAVADRLDCWDEGRGLADIRDDWVQRASGIGQRIRVRLPDEELFGLFDRIDPEGGLVLLLDSGEKRVIFAGDVFPAGQ